MKGLSIEQKAKRYDEALERVKELLSRCRNNGDRITMVYRVEDIESIFPELKKNEDEKIKEDLIEWINDFPDMIWEGHYKKDVIAWLEKQESCYSFEIKKGHWYKCVCDYMLNNSDLMFKNDRLYYCRSDWRLRGEIDERNVKNIGVNGYKSFFRPVTNQEIKEWLEKQDKQKSAWSEEDERNMQNIDSVLFYDKTLPEDTCIKLRDFLKTLKQRIGG